MEKCTQKTLEDTYKRSSKANTLTFLLGIITKKSDAYQQKHNNFRASSQTFVTVKPSTPRHKSRKIHFFNPKLAYQQLKTSQSPNRMHTTRSSLNDLPISCTYRNDSSGIFNSFLVISTKKLSGPDDKIKNRSQEVLYPNYRAKTQEMPTHRSSAQKQNQMVLNKTDVKDKRNKVKELSNSQIVGW
ncbi:hypothetical protein SteCoe_26869 [Stentor coeruleus]|uniref:Uncharacterized protein n=1 Tax=Stentor coeruleus TaxID=5963 RepID=A0A1R2BBQ5_9CILI|nr:hypothetical protein SteCoe_26869 [Stentor coeruleus]